MLSAGQVTNTFGLNSGMLMFGTAGTCAGSITLYNGMQTLGQPVIEYYNHSLDINGNTITEIPSDQYVGTDPVITIDLSTRRSEGEGVGHPVSDIAPSSNAATDRGANFIPRIFSDILGSDITAKLEEGISRLIKLAQAGALSAGAPWKVNSGVDELAKKAPFPWQLTETNPTLLQVDNYSSYPLILKGEDVSRSHRSKYEAAGKRDKEDEVESTSDGENEAKKIDLHDWVSTPEKLAKTLMYILDTQLRGDPMLIRSSDSFVLRYFTLPNRHRVSGYRILTAVAFFEHPEFGKARVLREIGVSEAAILARERYLSIKIPTRDWDSSPEKLAETFKYILDARLKGDPMWINTSRSFTGRVFILPGGSHVSGREILYAVASFERPGLTRYKAFKEIGGFEAVRLAIEKYLGLKMPTRDWDSSPAKLTKALRYILDTQLKGGPMRINSSRSFTGRVFILPGGRRVRGLQILYAVASFERPGLKKYKALQELNNAKAAKIAREKYLTRRAGQKKQLQPKGAAVPDDSPVRTN